MAQEDKPTNYKQGYSSFTTATHQLRTAEADAAFLIPHIKKTDHILDVGCGPGTITTSLAKYASEGKTVGLDLSAAVLEKAKKLAAEANVPTEGPGSVTFVEGNVVETLPYPDESFDVVYASQMFGHLPPPDLPLRALAEIRRVLKPGGVLATRDAVATHFYPRSFNLDELWGKNLSRSIHKGEPPEDRTSTMMPALMQESGFEEAKIKVGSASQVFSGQETRKWLLWRASGQLKEGDPFRQSWLDAGITEETIQQTLESVKKWSETDGAWGASMQGEMLAWK